MNRETKMSTIAKTTYLVFVEFQHKHGVKDEYLCGIVESKEAADALIEKLLANHDENSDYELSRRCHNNAPFEYVVKRIDVDKDGKVIY